MESSSHLIVHHVGGRSGSRTFPVLPMFEGDIVNVMYDADESCLPQVVEQWKSAPSMTLVLPHCLAAHDGVCQFHINYDPYTSSIFPLNPKYAPFYYPQNPPGYDYLYGDTVRTMSEVRLPTTTLDAVVLDRREAPAPDFLSIDTQGSELDILVGASRLLATTILAVQVEVEFQPLYQDQPLFGDICRFLSIQGFDLVDVRLFTKKYPMRGKHGFRGEGHVTDGDALFLKCPDRIAIGSNGLRTLQLNKSAFIATIFDRFEYAQQCFEAPGFETFTSPQPAANPQQRYLLFISRLASAVASLPKRSVPLFSERYSYEQSHARFQPQGAPRRPWLRARLAGVTVLMRVVRSLRGLARRRRLLEQRLQAWWGTAMMHARWRFKRPGSPVEAVFLEFGMKPQFLLAMEHRIQDAQS